MGHLKFSATRAPNVDEATKMAIVKKGSSAFQHADAVLPKVLFGSVSRGMTKNWFFKTLTNGKQVPRTWLLYSPHKEAAFCFCCLLFPCSLANAKSAFESPGGFCKWKKMEKVRHHEENPHHRRSFVEWKEMERTLKLSGSVDVVLEKQMEDERQRWQDILRRVLDVIKLLCMQNLPLRGHVESLDSANPGNFLATLNFLATYDPVISRHLSNTRENPGAVSYLSHDIQNEFISLLADTVRQKILQEIRDAKYFGILFDATPDVSHTEQLSEVIRYVRLDNDSGEVIIREVFLRFVELERKDAAGYEATIIEALENDQLDFRDCRAQMYDNAAVMSGQISSVQTRLRERNPKAIFVFAQLGGRACSCGETHHCHILWHSPTSLRVLLWVDRSMEEVDGKPDVHREEGVRHTLECEGGSRPGYCEFV